MDRKDIALTVGGVLATMVVAYLIYVRQQKDAAATAQAAADAEAQAEQNQEAQYSAGYQYSEQMPSFSTPSISLPSTSTSSTSSTVDTSASTAATGDVGTVDENSLLSQIIGDFSSAITNPGNTTNEFSSMILPTSIGGDNSNAVLSGIPTTATDAANESSTVLGTVEYAGVSPPSTIPVSSTTSTETTSTLPTSTTSVHFNHIIAGSSPQNPNVAS